MFLNLPLMCLHTVCTLFLSYSFQIKSPSAGGVSMNSLLHVITFTCKSIKVSLSSLVCKLKGEEAHYQKHSTNPTIDFHYNIMQARTGLIFQTKLTVKWSFRPHRPSLCFFCWPESHPSNYNAWHSGVIHIWVCLSKENLINLSRFDWASFLISAAGPPEFIFLELRSEMWDVQQLGHKKKLHSWNCFELIRFCKRYCDKKD